MNSIHTPVLLNEAIENLQPQPNKNYIDATFGGGGHSACLLDKNAPNGKILALDANPDVKLLAQNIQKKHKFGENLFFVNSNFCALKEVVKQEFNLPVHGILMDLGLSSDELEKSGRGFSFMKSEPLDMRYNSRQNLTASMVLNSYSLEDLIYIFKNYSDYPKPIELAKLIFKTRKKSKYSNTDDLVATVLGITPKRGGKKIHPATQIFQALRIEVNNELDILAPTIKTALEILEPQGRLAIISFHSGEDRIVKQTFRELAKQDEPLIKLITKKPIVPTPEEIKNNPRSRSAKLRVAEVI